MPKTKFVDRLKFLITGKLKSFIDDSVYDALNRETEKHYDFQATRTIVDTINQSLESSGLVGKSTMVSQRRFQRYNEYDTIIQNIPEQKKQVSLYYDMVINPEIYSTSFLNIDLNFEAETVEVNIKPSKDTNVEKRTVSVNEYLTQFLKTNNLYSIIKKSIYDALHYGDSFVEIIPPDMDSFNDDTSYDYKEVSNEISYKYHSPKRVVKLHIGNENFGYIVLPSFSEVYDYEEEKLTIDFLLRFIENLDPEQLEIFTDVVVNYESDAFTGKTKKDIYDLMEANGKNNNVNNDEPKDKTYNKIQEKIYQSDILKEAFVNKFKGVIKEQGFYKGATLSSQYPFVFQMDLSPYLSGNAGQVFSRSEVERLMEIDDRLLSLATEVKAKYVQPQNMVHFCITDYQYYPYGQGILEPVRSIQQLIMLLEYSMIIYRLLKAPDRKKYTIDVTGIPKENIPEYINKIKSTLKSNKTFNLDGGIDENLDLVTMMEDYFVLRKNGVDLVDVQNLEGGQIQSQIEDIDYWHKKLMQALGLPPSYLGFHESLQGNQTVLTIQDQRVQRTIIRYQSDLNEAIDQLIKKSFEILQIYKYRFTYPIDAAINELYDKYSVHLFRPQSLEQQAKQETVTQRLSQVTQLHDSTGFLIDDLLVFFGLFEQSEINQFRKNKEEYDKEHPEEQKEEEQPLV